MRTAIAEASGWTSDPVYYTEGPPDYLNDLNAMHEAEKVLHKMNNAQLCVVYKDLLNDFMERDRTHINAQGLSYHATARQRAEAFLRTLNLYTL